MKIELPDSLEVKQRKADNRGRVALGSKYAAREVTVVIFSEEERDD